VTGKPKSQDDDDDFEDEEEGSLKISPLGGIACSQREKLIETVGK